jgi:hypothetical protein
MMPLINPFERAERSGHADRTFEAKFAGLRAAANTIRGPLFSRNRNRM